MARWKIVIGSLIPTSPLKEFDFTSDKHMKDLKRAMAHGETQARLAQNKQDAAKLLRQSVRRQTKRIAAGAWD